LRLGAWGGEDPHPRLLPRAMRWLCESRVLALAGEGEERGAVEEVEGGIQSTGKQRRRNRPRPGFLARPGFSPRFLDRHFFRASHAARTMEFTRGIIRPDGCELGLSWRHGSRSAHVFWDGRGGGAAESVVRA